MKIAITGKGGVGKTTVAAVLARLYSEEGLAVLAIDADPDANLAAAIGFPAVEILKLRPIYSQSSLIEERTGAKPGEPGGMFKINPRVDDVVERYGINFENIRLISLGQPKRGGSGCYCPEHTFIKTLVTHHILKKDEVLILDMEAGIEHLGRGTARAVDAFLVVVEPGQRSFQTAREIRQLASDLGVARLFVIANKVHNSQDEDFIKSSLSDFEIIGFLPFDRSLIEADTRGESPFPLCQRIIKEVKRIKMALEDDNQMKMMKV